MKSMSMHKIVLAATLAMMFLSGSCTTMQGQLQWSLRIPS